MNLEIDMIVKEVLFRLGHISKAYVIKGMEYQKSDIENLGYIESIEFKETLEEGMVLWIPQLTGSQMMSIAAGISTDELSEWCLEALLKGVKVHVKKERVGFDFECCVFSPLVKKHMEALEILIKSGLKIVENIQKGAVTKYYNGNLLCEKEVVGWTKDSVKEVVLSKGTLLTPAAADTLKSEQIKWRKE